VLNRTGYNLLSRPFNLIGDPQLNLGAPNEILGIPNEKYDAKAIQNLIKKAVTDGLIVSNNDTGFDIDPDTPLQR
jgi:hypothetical protein